VSASRIVMFFLQTVCVSPTPQSLGNHPQIPYILNPDNIDFARGFELIMMSALSMSSANLDSEELTAITGLRRATTTTHVRNDHISAMMPSRFFKVETTRTHTRVAEDWTGQSHPKGNARQTHGRGRRWLLACLAAVIEGFAVKNTFFLLVV
jgi:hypothetical protein